MLSNNVLANLIILSFHMGQRYIFEQKWKWKFDMDVLNVGF